MTELRNAQSRCVQAKTVLLDIQRLLTSLITALEQRQSSETVNHGTVERCQHNLNLLVDSVEMINDLLQENDPTHICQELDRIFSALMQTGKWQPGQFLQSLQQRLIQQQHSWQLRATATATANTMSSDDVVLSDHIEPELSQQLQDSSMLIVFVHLYQATGKQLSSWLPQLHNLYHLLQSRPVYLEKQDALHVLQSRQHSSTDAYVALRVPKNAIASHFRSGAPTDKYGHELIRIDPESCPKQLPIDHFYHCQKLYHFVDGELIKVSDDPA